MTEQTPTGTPVQEPPAPISQSPPKGQKARKVLLIGGVIALIIIVIIVVVGLIFGVMVKKASEGLEEAGVKHTETKTGSLREEIPCGLNLTLIVHGVSRSKGNEFFQPEAGKYYLILDLEFRNNGEEEEAISSLMEMKIKDSEGREYSIALYPYETQLPEGDIRPGEKIRGQVAFEVPEGASGLQFEFDPLLGDTAIVQI